MVHASTPGRRVEPKLVQIALFLRFRNGWRQRFWLEILRDRRLFALDGGFGGGSWANRPIYLLCKDPALVDAASAREAVMHHARAKQINRDNECGQKQKLSDGEPECLNRCAG